MYQIALDSRGQGFDSLYVKSDGITQQLTQVGVIVVKEGAEPN